MTPWALIRKLGKLLRGGAGMPQILLGCVLGMIVGLVPGFNMTVVFAVLLLIVLNANLGLAIPAFLIGKVLCISLAPLTFRVGYIIIHNLGLHGLFRAASETPVVALMDLHYYCVAGGLPIAIFLGVAMGWASARLIRKARSALAAAGQSSSKVQWITGNILVRIILRLVFGKQKKTMAEMLEDRQPILCKGRVILCLILVGLVVGFEMLFLDSLAKRGLKSGLEMAIGAEVNIEKVDLSLFGGRFRMEGVQLTDPAKETHNSLQFVTLTSDISTTSLLARRFVIDELVIAGAKTDAKRDRPGYVLRKPEPPEPEITDDTVSKYFENGEKILRYLEKLRKYLEEREKAQDRKEAEAVEADKEKLRRLARAHGYFKLSAKSVLAKHPAVVIRKITIKDIEIRGKAYTLEATELSDSPELNPHPMTLRVSNSEGFEAGVACHFHEVSRQHEVQVIAPNIPLGEENRLSKKVPVHIAKGKVDARLKGYFNTREMDLPVHLRVSGLESSADRKFLGLDPQTSQRIAKHLTRVDLTLGLRGPIGAPRVYIDDRQLLGSLQAAMKDAAQAELAGLLDNQMKKVLSTSPVKLPGGLTDILPGKVTDPLGGLLPGGRKPKKKGPESRPGGLLRDLLK